ncbi:MAG: FAD-binding domain-containing protein [Alphaproteobacteria bacterium]
MDPARYGRTRNHLDGAVSRLSPYLRHGVLDLAEVRDAALDKAGEKAAWKFVNELAWRDYWQRLYESIGDGVWADREDPKTGHTAESFAADLPKVLVEARTGLACIDGFVNELYETGYLHNHARMWMAAYVIHFLRIRWQAGAQWFLTHLLDGDPASNNLSWQWVGSTFSSKPYFFNRDNVEKYTDGRFCDICPKSDTCPFDATYGDLAARLFPNDGGRQ